MPHLTAAEAPKRLGELQAQIVWIDVVLIGGVNPAPAGMREELTTLLDKKIIERDNLLEAMQTTSVYYSDFKKES